MTDASTAQRIIDANQYLTLATADAAGTPWATPVWYANEDHSAFLWVSRPGARHSRNLALRPEIGAVVFDSTVPAGQGTGVYLEAVAEELDGARRDQALATFTARATAFGLPPWRPTDVSGPAPFRLYRATTTAWYVLDAHDHRVPLDR